MLLDSYSKDTCDQNSIHIQFKNLYHINEILMEFLLVRVLS
jgi:hypothetical protein